MAKLVLWGPEATGSPLTGLPESGEQRAVIGERGAGGEGAGGAGEGQAAGTFSGEQMAWGAGSAGGAGEGRASSMVRLPQPLRKVQGSAGHNIRISRKRRSSPMYLAKAGWF